MLLQHDVLEIFSPSGSAAWTNVNAIIVSSLSAMFPSKKMQTCPFIIASPILSQNKAQSLDALFAPISLTSYAIELMWGTLESS